MRVREAMAATFSDRRKLIVNEGASVAEIKRLYPWLFDEEQVCSALLICPSIKIHKKYTLCYVNILRGKINNCYFPFDSLNFM